MQASVELSHVQEDLLREKHSKELITKTLVLDIEQRATKEEVAQRIFAEKEKAYLSIIRAYQGNKSPEEIRRLNGRLIHTCTHIWEWNEHDIQSMQNTNPMLVNKNKLPWV